MNARACTRFSDRVALSMYATDSALPSFPTTISRAIAPVISVNRPVACAGGIMTWLELKFEAVMQPRPHWAQYGQAARPFSGLVRIASREGTQWIFNLSQDFLMMVSVQRGGGGGRKMPSGALGI